MTEQLPIACSLGAGDTERRLAVIGEIGEASLVGRDVVEGRQLLRFRQDDRTREQLEAFITAETVCCPFLDLAIQDQGAELILSIAAPEDGRAIAGQLAAAFAGGRDPSIPPAPIDLSGNG